MPSISGLYTSSVWITVENKTPSASNLVKKTDYNIKLSEFKKKTTDNKHDKYISTPEVNKVASKKFGARLA